jgi:hypothetical protein
VAAGDRPLPLRSGRSHAWSRGPTQHRLAACDGGDVRAPETDLLKLAIAIGIELAIQPPPFPPRRTHGVHAHASRIPPAAQGRIPELVFGGIDPLRDQRDVRALDADVGEHAIAAAHQGLAGRAASLPAHHLREEELEPAGRTLECGGDHRRRRFGALLPGAGADILDFRRSLEERRQTGVRNFETMSLIHSAVCLHEGG